MDEGGGEGTIMMPKTGCRLYMDVFMIRSCVCQVGILTAIVPLVAAVLQVGGDWTGWTGHVCERTLF